MPRKKKSVNVEDQGELLDIRPKNAKQISAAARAYRVAERAAQAAREAKAVHGMRIAQLVREADLQPLPDGTYRVVIDDMVIVVSPREDAVKVTGGDTEDMEDE